MLKLSWLRQEAKREQLRESRQILEQVAREIERAKQIEIREKQIKAAAYQDILEASKSNTAIDDVSPVKLESTNT